MSKDRLVELFDSVEGVGLATEIVLSEYEVWINSQYDLPDYREVRRFFEEKDCSGLVSIVEFLEKNPKCTQVGSGSIDLSGVSEETFSVQRSRTLSRIRIGFCEIGVTPLMWLIFLSRGFDRIPNDLWEGFDSIIAQLVSPITSSSPLGEEF